jgi:hypothetical protein
VRAISSASKAVVDATPTALFTITRRVSSALSSDMFWCTLELAKRVMFWSVETKRASASSALAAFSASSRIAYESDWLRIGLLGC